MANIRLTISGLKKILSTLQTLKLRVLNLKPAYKQIADNFREVEKVTFANQGGRRKWTPLSPNYAKWKSKKYPGKPIMVLTGDLKNSLINQGGDHVEIYTRKSLTIGSKVKYGNVHQFGSRKRKIPRRPPIDPRSQDTKEWRDIMLNYLIESLGFRK